MHMSHPRTVAVLVGSLRKDSVTRKVAGAVSALAPNSLAFKVVEIGALPHYNQDDEAEPPEAWTEFRRQVADADAVLYVTPEFNRSVPGALKNAVDVGSRPYGQGVLNGKPSAVISVSAGALAGYAANHHLRQSLLALNVPVLSQETYIGDAFGLFDDGGVLVNESTAEFLSAFGRYFADWIERFAEDQADRKAA
jgi:chromate reductase